MNSEYLSELRKLSLTARAAIALLVCEKYFESHNIRNKDTVEFLNFMWELPIVVDFEQWETNRPVLVNFGLGDEISESMAEALELSSADQSNFRAVVSGTVEILWSSFWGAAEDEVSNQALNSVIQSSRLKYYPVLTPFKFSTFVEGDGWGKPISTQDRDFWRERAKYA